MIDPLYRRLAREHGARGARDRDIERLREVCGGWLPPDYESFLCEVGDFSALDSSFDLYRIEWTHEPAGTGIFDLREVLELAELRVDNDPDMVPLSRLQIGFTWDKHPLLSVAEKSSVFGVADHGVPSATDSLLAGSFWAYEVGIVLPEPLVLLQGQYGHLLEGGAEFMVLEKPRRADPVRGLAVFDNLLDRLVDVKLPKCSTEDDGFRFGIFGPDHAIFTVDESALCWPNGLLLMRYRALSILLEAVVILDQTDGVLLDKMGLFSDRFDAEYSKAEIVDILVDRLGGARCLDELALLFREKFSVPAAKRLMAAQRG